MAEESVPITPAGLERLRAELKRIKEVDRPENVRDIETAREHGDLRENAEYHAAKERQGNLEGRLRFLEHRLGHAEVIDPATIKSDRVAFGATVTVLGRNRAALDELVAAGAAHGAVIADVSDQGAVNAAIAEAAARQPIDILVANAGAAESAPFGNFLKLFEFSFRQ